MSMRDSISVARISGPVLQADGTTTIEFRFDASDPTFAGHFPARPILPGVFQLEIARASAEWALGFPLAVLEISKAKFLRPILPGEIVRVDLKISDTESGIDARAIFSAAGQPAGETLLKLSRVP